MINKKTLTVAVVESLSILLFNLAFIFSIYGAAGADLTAWQQVVQIAISCGLALVRIVWFYIVLIYADQIENARIYLSDLIEKARK